MTDRAHNRVGRSDAGRTRGADAGGTRRDAVRPRRAGAGASAAGSRRPRSGGSSDAGTRRGDSRGSRPTRSRSADLMRYAADNRVVSAVHEIVAGPYRVLFYLAVAAAVALAFYFPLKDLYSAYRTNDIAQRQLAIRERYNESLQGEVDSLLSTEGIEDAARELGYVMPGEQSLDVIGLPDDSSGSDGAQGSADAGQDASGSGESGSDASGGDGEAADGGADANPDGDADGGSGTDGGAAAEGASGSSDPSAADAQGADGASGAADAEPSTSAEVEAAERAAAQEAPWYIKLLDAIFFYQGAEGQRVVSSGD